MKKFIYSGYTKLAAAILLIICTAAGTLILTDGFADYFDKHDNIYGFENSFSESSHINSLLNSVESVIYHTYIINLLPCIEYDEDAENIGQNKKLLNNRTTITMDILNTLTVQSNLPVFFKRASLAVFILPILLKTFDHHLSSILK